MSKGTIPNNESPVTSSNALPQSHASSSTTTDNNSSFVSVINNGYTAASREFERFFSSWGFNKRTNSTEAISVESTQNKYHGKRKRDSNESNNNNNNSNSSGNTDEHNGTALYDAHHLPSSTYDNRNITTNKPLIKHSPAQILEPRTPDSSNNAHQHRHTFQYLVERQHSPQTQSQDIISSKELHQHQYRSENKAPTNTSTQLLNDSDTTMNTTKRLKSESTPYTTTTTRSRSMAPLYVPSAIDTAKYMDLDLLEEERLAKLERIIREAHSNATQLLSISQNSKSSRTVRFSPIVKHASIISSHTSRSPSNPPPLVSSTSYLSPQRSSSPLSSAYTRAELSSSLENPRPSPRRAIVTTPRSLHSPHKIKNEPTASPSFCLSRLAHDPFTTTTATTTITTISNGTEETIPKNDDKDDISDRTDKIPLKANLLSSRSTSFEPIPTSSTELKTSSPSSSAPIYHRLSAFNQSSVDHHFEQQQCLGSIVNGHKVLPTEQPQRQKLKTVDFDEAHKKNMGIIIHQIPKVILRRTDTIRGPDGQWKPNPIWNEIYNNGKNKSRPL